MGPEFHYDVFLSHSAKDKAVVRPSSLSASIGERIPRTNWRFAPLNPVRTGSPAVLPSGKYGDAVERVPTIPKRFRGRAGARCRSLDLAERLRADGVSRF